MKNDNFGKRMKEYEYVTRFKLTKKIPVIVRLDGKSFHTFTKKYCNEKFDADFMYSMMWSAIEVYLQTQGCKIIYIQSDEVSFLLTDYDNIETDAYFDYNIQKIVSVMASQMSVSFNTYFSQMKEINTTDAVFDGRAFNIPKEEIVNYFLWRMKDCERNSLNTYARMFFSHKQLHKKNKIDKHEMLHEIGKNWAIDLNNFEKNGILIILGDIIEDFELNYENLKYLFESYQIL